MNQLPQKQNDRNIIKVDLKGKSPKLWEKLVPKFNETVNRFFNKHATTDNINRTIDNGMDSIQQKLNKDKFQNAKNYKSAELDHVKVEETHIKIQKELKNLERNKATLEADIRTINNNADISDIDKKIKIQELIKITMDSLYLMADFAKMNNIQKHKLMVFMFKKNKLDKDIINMLSCIENTNEDGINPEPHSDEIIDT